MFLYVGRVFFSNYKFPSKSDQIKLDLGFSLKESEEKNENPFKLSDFLIYLYVMS